MLCRTFLSAPSQYSTSPNSRLKSTLHILILILTLTSITLFSIAIPKWDANFFHNTGAVRGDWTDGLPLGPLSFTFLVSLFHIVSAHLFHHQPTPRHSIILGSLALISLAPALFLAGHGSLFVYWQPPAQRSQSGVVVCNLRNIFSRECEPLLYAVGELQLAGVAVGGASAFIVFLTVLVGLRDERMAKLRARRERGTRTLILSGGSGSGSGSRSGWADLEKGASASQHEESERDRQRRRRHRHRRHQHQRRQYGGSQGASDRSGSGRYLYSSDGASSIYSQGHGYGDSDVVPIYVVQQPEPSYYHQGGGRRTHRYS